MVMEGDVVVLGPGEDVGVRMGGDVDTEEDTATSFSMDGRGTSGPAFDCGRVEFWLLPARPGGEGALEDMSG